jgi:hypothetical protein
MTTETTPSEKFIEKSEESWAIIHQNTQAVIERSVNCDKALTSITKLSNNFLTDWKNFDTEVSEFSNIKSTIFDLNKKTSNINKF